MIREKKSENVPASLLKTQLYNGEDVKRQLMEDQHEKCYICERKLTTDFEIEHLKSQNKYPDLAREWSNLFLACGYCNRKKSDSFDNNVNPLTVNIEEDIIQRIDFDNNEAIFQSLVADKQHDNTVEMLNMLYNGKECVKLRSIKEERFFNYAKQQVISFLRIIYDYIMNPTKENYDLVTEALAIDKEFLGFKYWIICDYSLSADFKNNIIWNK